MKPQSITSFYSNLARIFLFLAIVKAIDFGFMDTSAYYSGDLPCEVNTEYLQDQAKDVLNLNVFDVAAKAKISGNPFYLIPNIFHLQNRYFIYKQKLTKQPSGTFASVSFFLVTSKSNIPHRNLDGEEPSSFQPKVV